MGHLQVRSVNSISVSLRAFFSTSRTEASASGLISLAEGCGGSGWPAGTILRAAGDISELTAGCAAGAGLGAAAGFGCAAAGFGSAAFALAGSALAAFSLLAALLPPVARFDRPRRCTLPITALRVTPPNSLAIWLALWPSPHIFLRSSTRSSVQDIVFSTKADGRGDPLPSGLFSLMT